MFDFDFDIFPDVDGATTCGSRNATTCGSKNTATYCSTADGIKNTEEEEKRVRELEAAVAGLA
jgi:hypothetical protein